MSETITVELTRDEAYALMCAPAPEWTSTTYPYEALKPAQDKLEQALKVDEQQGVT